ncbi:MAG: hypothetical protein DMF69_24450 [Acidobacteria bacterium]|nr:MAG: hypothetical protein DMF69_24450 [Acidobacteriota bacterium]
MKKHLRPLKAGGGDEYHPADDPLWNTLTPFLTLYSRPKSGLTEEARKNRHKESNARWFVKNRPAVLEAQKAERKAKKDAAIAAKVLATSLERREELVKTMSEAILATNNHIHKHYGHLALTTVEEWAWKEGSSTTKEYIFPRFITYYLPTELWPDPATKSPQTPLCDSMPGETHIRKLSAFVRPDKHGGDEKLADAWKVFISDPKWMKEPGYADEDAAEYDARSDEHKIFANLYEIWQVAYLEALPRVTPRALSVNEINAALISHAKAVEAINIAQDRTGIAPEKMIEESKKLKDYSVPGKGGRKRKLQEQLEETDAATDEATDEVTDEAPEMIVQPVSKRTRSGKSL